MKKIVLLFVLIGLTSCALNNINPKDIQREAVYESYAYDPTNPLDLMNQSEYVSKFKIKDIETFSEVELGEKYPSTRIEVELLERLKVGDETPVNELLWTGGLIKSEEVKDDIETTKKYVYFEYTDILKLKKNTEYVIAYSQDEFGFRITANGYGIFEVNEEKSELVNLINKRKVKINDIGD